MRRLHVVRSRSGHGIYWLTVVLDEQRDDPIFKIACWPNFAGGRHALVGFRIGRRRFTFEGEIG